MSMDKYMKTRKESQTEDSEQGKKKKKRFSLIIGSVNKQKAIFVWLKDNKI